MFTPHITLYNFSPSVTQFPTVSVVTTDVGETGFSGELPKSHLDLFLPDSRPIDLHVRLYPEWFKEVSVSWTVPTSWNTQSPRFNVYRSEVEGSGYQKLTTVPIQAPFFVDNATKESSKHSKEFYVIEAILADGTIWKTKPAWVGDRLPRWQHIRLKEINRREWLLLRKFVGNEAIILRAIHYGPRCPNCYDKVSEKLLKPYCAVCFGTGYDKGYYPGIRSYLQFDASADNAMYTYLGKMEQNEISAWTIQYPDLEPFDMIIRLKDYKVFRVKQVANTEILNKICRQMARLEELAPESVLYELLKREGVNV